MEPGSSTGAGRDPVGSRRVPANRGPDPVAARAGAVFARHAKALGEHWPEYLIEAGGLGLFMVSAGVFGTLFEFPGSTVYRMIPDPGIRRALMGIAMGGTAIGLVYSRWGMRSGAHFNPATTLTFFRLGKVRAVDAVFYSVAHFMGAVAGVLLVGAVLGESFEAAPVLRVGTLPGAHGAATAFLAEIGISGLLMTMVLNVTNTERLHVYAGLLAGLLVAVFITFEAPISGMSMNPARSFGSLAVAGLWRFLWIYFLAPPIGMLIAAQIYLRRRGREGVRCAKMHHHNDQICIFRCGYAPAPAGVPKEG